MHGYSKLFSYFTFNGTKLKLIRYSFTKYVYLSVMLLACKSIKYVVEPSENTIIGS
jgi:hypothetical protein